MGRQRMEVRKRIVRTMLAYGKRLFPYLPGRTVAEKRACFLVLFPGMAGVLVTARAIPYVQGRDRMLASARSFYLSTFAAEADR
jgi:hypothetical protein